MNLPIEFPHRMSASVGGKPEDGDGLRGGLAVLNFAQLEVPIEWMRFCAVCQSEQRFVAQIEVGNGVFGCCANCGDERVVPFTRTVESE